jgi:uncharacterized membrane protein YbhN (UPF0104 family)
MAAVPSPVPTFPRPGPELRRRVTTAALLAVLAVALLVAVPGLRPVLTEIGGMSPAWVFAALALELASSLSFVVVFRLFFERLPARDARALAWTSMASGALLPVGGAGGLAISGWLMRLSGLPSRWIVQRSSGLFFLTSSVNMAVVAGAGLLLLTGSAGPHDFPRAAVPVIGAAALTLAVVALPVITGRRSRRRRTVFLGGLVAGIRDAESALRNPSWRLAGAIGYLGFDIAVMWAVFSALGHAPAVAPLVLGYSIGYIANALPVPGGVGVVDGGLAGALLLYGAPAAQIAAAVLVYRTIAVWLPGLGGLLAYGQLRRRLGPAPAVATAPASVPALQEGAP